jgi:chitinase
MTSPANGSTRQKGTITVTASASDPGTGSGAASGIKQVQFFRDSGTSLGTDTTANYSASWSATVGTHTLYAVATDNAGNTTTSAVITVTITN